MKVIFHRANNREWLWTVVAGNNKIVGSSSETYHNKNDCVENFQMISGRVVAQDMDEKSDNNVDVAYRLHDVDNTWEVVYQ